MKRHPIGPGRPSRQNPPKAPGVYRWISKVTGGIQDIGETSNLSRRKNQKEYSSDNYHFEWQKADGRSSSNTRRLVERRQIDKHQPPGNLRRRGAGRKAAR